ncbi:hypothetical protein BDN72DRAFT_810536 [Pluteus cervinus]|uniref:Uncharacterized protein n=1 Tax=Pluteus cervinus TaxID=181527 RepID=A0ACD3BDD7_9AGAR|nr:hypothetical protein BDN72DRAFT_810536 [Pluteus cervinus]
MMRSSITTLRRPLLNTLSSRTITSLSYGRIQRPSFLSTQLRDSPGSHSSLSRLRFTSHASGPSPTNNQGQKHPPQTPQLGPESFSDPTRPDLFYHLLKPSTPSSSSLPVFALSFLHTPPPIKDSKTVIGWLPAATPYSNESTGGEEEEAGLNDFKENVAFRDTLHKAVQSGLTDGIDDIQINAATQLHAGWMHIHDERNIPALGRIGDPDDILATVLVEDGKILPETYQPMPAYRLCTSDGITQLTPGLSWRLRELLQKQAELERSSRS